jgi:serine O-acetyltransferase
MFDNLKEDLHRYGDGGRQQIRAILLSPCVWAIIGYRFARWAYTAQLPRPVRKLMNMTASLVNVFVEVTTNIELPAQAEIGPGLLIVHTGCTVLSSGVRMGRHCTLGHGVTIGHAGGGGNQSFDCPIIGDRVYIGPSASIIGGITIGDDALIGIGAVVTRSVAARGVAVGNPARVISHDGSFNIISYRGMDKDSARQAALVERLHEAKIDKV